MRSQERATCGQNLNSMKFPKGKEEKLTMSQLWQVLHSKFPKENASLRLSNNHWRRMRDIIFTFCCEYVREECETWGDEMYDGQLLFLLIHVLVDDMCQKLRSTAFWRSIASNCVNSTHESRGFKQCAYQNNARRSEWPPIFKKLFDRGIFAARRDGQQLWMSRRSIAYFFDYGASGKSRRSTKFSVKSSRQLFKRATVNFSSFCRKLCNINLQFIRSVFLRVGAPIPQIFTQCFKPIIQINA